MSTTHDTNCDLVVHGARVVTPDGDLENGGVAVRDGRLAMDISDSDEELLETLLIGLARFRRPIREYFAICDSYYQAIRKATPSEIETIDMARRGIHNSAAELLLERLDGKVETDFATARRLFTLICVLHIKG